MGSEILQELLAEYEQIRSQDQMEETRRRQQAEAEIPGMAEALAGREQLIVSSIQGLLTGRGQQQDTVAAMTQYNRQIISLLTSHKYAVDWLEPVYRCAKCQDTGYVGDTVREMCTCMRQRYYARLCRSIGLPDDGSQSYEQWDHTLFSTDADPVFHISQRQAMDLIRSSTMQWTDQWPRTDIKTIVLSGKSGLGKTYVLHCMARRLLNRGINVMLVSAFHMLDVARKAYFSGNADEYESLMYADVLMIDDLGSEPLFDNVTVTQLFNLLNERINAGRATIFSTNLSMMELRSRYTERIASRLSDTHSSREYRFIGSDLRTSTKEKA